MIDLTFPGVVLQATDADLVLRARGGSTAAFAVLYERYRRPVTDYARRIVLDHASAEDVVQEAFVSALRKLGDLRDPDRFRPWLFSIVHRAAVDVVRADGPLLLPDPPEPDPAPPASADVVDLVWDAVATLEPRQRAILELTLREELTTSEVAQALGVGTAHAAVLVHRSKAALGKAVRILLLVRDGGHCARLAALAPADARRLTARERMSVDRHLRRCPVCTRLLGKVTVPLAVLAAMVFARKTQTPYTSTSRTAPLAVAGVGAVALLLLWWPTPHSTLVLPEPTPPSIVTTTPVTTSTVAPPPPPPVTTTASRAAPPSEEQRLIGLINDARARAGCGKLRADNTLMAAAREHSASMASDGEITLTTADGRSVADRADDHGHHGPTAASVAASTETAEDTLPSMEAEATDCAYRTIGLSRATGGPPCYFYWTLILGG